MPRLARIVLPEYPHHIVQRGNRRQDVFFKEGDYQAYLSLLKQWCAEEEIEALAYCLMTNHVHLVLVPSKTSNLSRAVGEVHRRYTRRINFREGWTGYLWQGRFSSYVLDEHWLLNTLAYVEINPVKAGMVKQAWDYRWSSVHAHLSGVDPSGLVSTGYEKRFVDLGDWRAYLGDALEQNDKLLMQHERTGRPLGTVGFVEHVGRCLGRDLKKKRPGPKVDRGN